MSSYGLQRWNYIQLFEQKRVLHNSTHILLGYYAEYIHNWPLQLFSQNYCLASHTTHVVCVDFIREWRNLQFNVDSERQIY